jgi:hypothetical protein
VPASYKYRHCLYKNTNVNTKVIYTMFGDKYK